MKKKRKEFWHQKNFVLEMAPFKQEILVMVNYSRDEAKSLFDKSKDRFLPDFIKEAKKCADDWAKIPSSTQASYYPMKQGAIIFLKADKNSFRKTIGCLAHELLHAVHYKLRDVRIPLKTDSEEVYTYSLENLLVDSLYQLYD